jgi:hypothetical protein
MIYQIIGLIVIFICISIVIYRIFKEIQIIKRDKRDIESRAIAIAIPYTHTTNN